MIKIAVYGKGGIGKSTTVSNIAAALAEQGLKIMQIGCDPKADSTINLHNGTVIPTVLDLVRTRKNDFSLEEMTTIGYKGIIIGIGGPAIAINRGRNCSAALTISLISLSSSPMMASISDSPDMYTILSMSYHLGSS
jgi:nitrogenase iron protein NifH